MSARSAAAWIVGILAVGLPALAAAAEPAAAPSVKAAFAGPPAPEELQVLSPLVGRGKMETAGKPSLRFPEGFTASGEVTGQWVHNGHFLRLEGSSTSARGRFEWTEMISYDRATKQYRRFVFSSEGVMAESVGTWDASAQQMTWQGVHIPDGWTAVATTSFKQREATFVLQIKNDRGELVRDATATIRPQ